MRPGRHQRLDRLGQLDRGDVAADEPAEDVALGQDAERGVRRGCTTNTESPVPVRRIASRQSPQARARRDGHRLAPADDLQPLVEERSGRVRRRRPRSGRSRGQVYRVRPRPAGAPSTAFDSLRRRRRASAARAASLGRWNAAAGPSGSCWSSCRRPASPPGRSSRSRSTRPGSTGSSCSPGGSRSGRRWPGPGCSSRPPGGRRSAGSAGGRPSGRAGLGVWYTGNAGTYYAGPRDGAGLARRRPRLPLPGDRRGPLRPVRDASERPPAVDRPRDRPRRRRSSPSAASSSTRRRPSAGCS